MRRLPASWTTNHQMSRLSDLVHCKKATGSEWWRKAEILTEQCLFVEWTHMIAWGGYDAVKQSPAKEEG